VRRSKRAQVTTSNVELVGKTIESLHQTIPAYRQQYEKFNVVRLAGFGTNAGG
jgi:hypothetical protein